MLPCSLLIVMIIVILSVVITLKRGQPSRSQSQTNFPVLNSTEISSVRPFTLFAATAYCDPTQTINWSCDACQENEDFIPMAAGGDGESTQFWYVGYAPTQGTVIVAHEGTTPDNIYAIATDLHFSLKQLDATLFPGIDSSIEAHSGFANDQANSAVQVLSAVQNAIETHDATLVTVVGHSLGAAIALIDAVYLSLHIDGMTFRVMGYGMPRVGNQAFADYVDAHINVTHINNKEDLIPIVPGIILGYHHPSGEVHIMDNNEWVFCPGQDNPSIECSTGDVPNVFSGNTSDHHGPYGDISMNC